MPNLPCTAQQDWQGHSAEVSKKGQAHRVPLAPQTHQPFDELRELTGHSKWVPASPRKEGAHITAVLKAAERLARETEINFVPHDLRRTPASCMTSMGISRLVVSKILNHAESGITAVYDRHSYDAEKREALIQWAARLDSILGHLPIPSQTGHRFRSKLGSDSEANWAPIPS